MTDIASDNASIDEAASAAVPPVAEPYSEPERGAFSLEHWIKNPRTIISFVLAIALIVYIVRSSQIDVNETRHYARSINPWTFLTAFVVFYLAFPVRALRWRMLLNNAGVPVESGKKSWASIPALCEYIFLSWFANCIVPAKLGDAYRGYLLKRNGGTSFSTTMGTVFAERLLDMLGLFALLVLSDAIDLNVLTAPAGPEPKEEK